MNASCGMLSQVWHSQGIRGFYHGHRLQVIMECLGRGLYFSVYEVFKSALGLTVVSAQQTADSRQQAVVSGESTPSAALALILVAAAGSGMTMWTVLYPLDVARVY